MLRNSSDTRGEGVVGLTLLQTSSKGAKKSFHAPVKARQKTNSMYSNIGTVGNAQQPAVHQVAVNNLQGNSNFLPRMNANNGSSTQNAPKSTPTRLPRSRNGNHHQHHQSSSSYTVRMAYENQTGQESAFIESVNNNYVADSSGKKIALSHSKSSQQFKFVQGEEGTDLQGIKFQSFTDRTAGAQAIPSQQPQSQNVPLEQYQRPINQQQIGLQNYQNSLFEEPIRYHIEPSKHSSKKNGLIKAYAANTHHGLFRNYNEDRVSIILSISKPSSKKIDYWPKCSFFAVYDGHGGSGCADFLRDNLHLFVIWRGNFTNNIFILFLRLKLNKLMKIIREENFPANPEEAIRRGFFNAEQTFIRKAEESGDRSGSCAIVVMILDVNMYVANVGDSRAVLSSDGGAITKDLSVDHKPGDERERIQLAGGRVYQTNIANLPSTFTFAGIKIVTPFRVFPGKLSVSRTIGDKDAKLPKYGGNPKVVIAEPDIKHFVITDKFDFVVLGSDGIFDRLNSDEAVHAMWQATQEQRADNVHEQSGLCVEYLIKESFERKTLDNVTVVMICFSHMKRKLFPKTRAKEQSQQLKNSHLSAIEAESKSASAFLQHQKLLSQATEKSAISASILQPAEGNFMNKSLVLATAGSVSGADVSTQHLQSNSISNKFILAQSYRQGIMRQTNTLKGNHLVDSQDGPQSDIREGSGYNNNNSLNSYVKGEDSAAVATNRSHNFGTQRKVVNNTSRFAPPLPRSISSKTLVNNNQPEKNFNAQGFNGINKAVKRLKIKNNPVSQAIIAQINKSIGQQ